VFPRVLLHFNHCYYKKPSCRSDSRPYCLTVPLGSRDDIGYVNIWLPNRPFPIGGPLERSLYLQPFLRYCALSVSAHWGHEFDLSGSSDVIGNVTIR